MSNPNNQDHAHDVCSCTVKQYTEYDFTHLGHNQPRIAQFAYCLNKAPRAKLTEDDFTACICCMEEWRSDGNVTPVRLACNHLICRDCAEDWFGRPKKTCPTCRTVLMTCEEAVEDTNVEHDEEDEMPSLGGLTAGVVRWLEQLRREQEEESNHFIEALRALARKEEEAMNEIHRGAEGEESASR